MSYLSLITPINIAEEKEKFFTTDTYSPQFKYGWSEQRIRRYRNDPDLAQLVDALLSQDKVKIEAAAKHFFNVEFRQEDIDYAEKLVEYIPERHYVIADEYADLAIKKFREFNIDYRVEVVDKHGFQGRPDHRHKVLRLSKYMRPEFYSADGLVNHELVHIIRAVNGNYNSILPQIGYLPTDEGLAGLVQDNMLDTETSSSFQHALEYLSARIAAERGFREVFEFLKEHGCSDESAWLRGIRQKFGICDTSLPGSLMKSGMSFYHELLLKNLAEEKLIRLFVGKIPMDMLPAYPKYVGQIPDDKIRDLLGSK
jgi:hypothetical protein